MRKHDSTCQQTSGSSSISNLLKKLTLNICILHVNNEVSIQGRIATIMASVNYQDLLDEFISYSSPSDNSKNNSDAGSNVGEQPYLDVDNLIPSICIRNTDSEKGAKSPHFCDKANGKNISETSYCSENFGDPIETIIMNARSSVSNAGKVFSAESNNTNGNENNENNNRGTVIATESEIIPLHGSNWQLVGEKRKDMVSSQETCGETLMEPPSKKFATTINILETMQVTRNININTNVDICGRNLGEERNNTAESDPSPLMESIINTKPVVSASDPKTDENRGA